MAAPGGSAETQRLHSIGLIEKDVNGETLWVWSYPSITPELRELMLRKCRLQEEKPPPLYNLLYGQYRKLWFYMVLTAVEGASVLEVTHFCVVLLAKEFNPEKYSALSRVLSRIYLKSGSPVAMMERYLSVLTRGGCQSEENGTFLWRDYPQREAYLSAAVKDVILRFGMEAVILYTALMLKRKVAVYHPRPDAVQEFTRALPALVWHRQDWSILHPYVHLSSDETDALKTGTAGFVAGFHDPDVGNRPDLYDVFVNLAENSITVSPSAKEAMTLGKLHKEIGQLMLQAAEDPEKSDSQVIKDICVKTRDIIAVLSSCAEENGGSERPTITLQRLKQQKFPPATENFLIHLAAAENFLLT
ncbi:DENN domain-containing protein 10 isoform X2 [Dendropsophus ebraccatus]|uniref:DENN domain-containing protein 10 isoform X2 n=1 Tax=Dendropsophus ebraccatus TaxID=150705 RepID=UPI0038319F40